MHQQRCFYKRNSDQQIKVTVHEDQGLNRFLLYHTQTALKNNSLSLIHNHGAADCQAEGRLHLLLYVIKSKTRKMFELVPQ